MREGKKNTLRRRKNDTGYETGSCLYQKQETPAPCVKKRRKKSFCRVYENVVKDAL
jgi:hypothetical protein